MFRRMLLIGVLVCVGCSGPTDDSADDGGSVPPAATTTATEPDPEPQPEPEPEPTDPETTQTRRNQPAVKLPSAPIGGSADVDGAKQCAPANWLGRTPLPEGTKITLGAPRFSSDGVFELDQDACGGKRACPGVVWSGPEPEPCYVGARQLTKSAGDSVTLVIPAEATCATESDCTRERLLGNAGGSLTFTPIELEPEPEPEPTGESPEPTQPPSTEPTEPPTPEPTATG